MRHFSWWWVLFLSAGCGLQFEEPKQWPAAVVDLSGFSDTQKVSLNESFQWMNEALGYSVIEVQSPENEQYAISLARVGTNSEHPSRMGFATRDNATCKIELNKQIFEIFNGELVNSVVLHELGHCAGLDHNPRPGSVMYATTQRFSKFSEEELRLFVEDFKKALETQAAR